MNKENIEKKKRMLKDFSEKGQGQRVFFEEDLELIRDILQHLEQKESILDKVTEFIKDDVTAEDIKFEGSKTVHFIYKNLINITKEKIAECINSYKDEIEDIIEGEKK